MTKDEILEIAFEAGFGNYVYEAASMFERFAALVAEKEREECAKAAEDYLTKGRSPLGIWVAKAIRARGQK